MSMARQLFEAIGVAFERNVLHRDISSGNVLCAPDGRLVWIDWECAAPVGSESRARFGSRQRTGTLDTMSIEALEGFPFVYLPQQELESGVYLMWKLIMTNKRLRIRVEDISMFTTRRKLYYWEVVPDSPVQVAQSRNAMWGRNALIEPIDGPAGGTGRDLAMMAKSLPVEVFLIHESSQIQDLHPLSQQKKGVFIEVRFYDLQSALFSIAEQANGRGKTWAAEMGIA